MPLLSIIRARHRLGEDTISAMYDVFSRYYSNTSPENFRRDLDGKDRVILQMRPDGTLAGFSTACLFSVHVNGRLVRVLFSGDTIIDRDARQSSGLAGAFGHLTLRIGRQASEPLYWLLISKGYRTYRFLPVFYHEFYPVYDKPTPDAYSRLLDVICTARFGSAWNASTGIIDFGPLHERLAPSQCGVDPHRLSDPHVRFFLQKNPRYAQGTELACITPLDESNLNRYGRRVIASTKVIWDE